MTEPLRTELWLKAHLRQCHAQAVPAVVLNKGDPDRGTLLLKLNLLDGGCRVLSQQRDLDGRLGWMEARPSEAALRENGTIDEVDADAYIERAVRRDPDLWVVEIEHRDGWHPFEGQTL